MTKRVAVIGLGSMGFGVAQSILRAGHKTYGYDMMPVQMKKFRNEGGAEGRLEDIAGDLEVIVVVVLNAAQTEDVLFGANGLVQYLSPGAVVIACATVSPECATKMDKKCGEHDVHYLDAPISGGSVKAANGELSIMASGSREAFATARPVLDAMAEKVFELGNEAGLGSAMKAVNQLLAGVHIAAMAEALVFGMTQGIEPETFVNIISQCAGTSWMLENRAPHIVEGDYTPYSSIEIWPKDLGIVLEIAKSARYSAPLTAVALQQFVAASGSGLGDQDDSAVAKIYARNVGLILPERK